MSRFALVYNTTRRALPVREGHTTGGGTWAAADLDMPGVAERVLSGALRVLDDGRVTNNSKPPLWAAKQAVDRLRADAAPAPIPDPEPAVVPDPEPPSDMDAD